MGGTPTPFPSNPPDDPSFTRKTLDNILFTFAVAFLYTAGALLLAGSNFDLTLLKTTLGVGLVTALGVYKDKNIPMFLKK